MRVCPISSLVVRAYLTHVPRDEFAEVKAVKLLRRGRRLQQVEYVPISHFQPHQRLLIIHHRAVYGKTCDSPLSQKSSTSALVIPQLKVEFLQSPFFRRFCVQRTRPFSHQSIRFSQFDMSPFPGPVIEPTEFTSRYLDHVNGNASLNVEGQMLAMLLVTWAASFGINEYGGEIDELDPPPTDPTSPKFTRDSDDELADPKQRVWAVRTDAMAREILALVDTHGILRRPSWDGVRVLLLLLPLTEGRLKQTFFS